MAYKNLFLIIILMFSLMILAACSSDTYNYYDGSVDADGDVTEGDIVDGDIVDGDIFDGDKEVDGDIVDGEVDGDEEVDGDVVEGDAQCEPVINEDMDCVYRPDTGADSCESLGWNTSCGNSFCVQAGYNYSCGENSKCVKACSVDNGDTETVQNSADYVGVWGGVYSTAIRNDDMPLVGYQDTVSIHHTITHAFVRDSRLYFHHKTCNLVISNFKGDKLFYDKDLAYMVVPEAYFKSVPVVEQYVTAPPKFEAGAKFDTSRAWECRGVKMAECTNLDDPIPGREEYEAGDTRIWDQDFDGKPAMTSVMAGVLNGEVYSVQRWSTLFEAEIVDHDRIWGINNHTNEQHNIDATSAALLTNIVTIPHADIDRSFFRLFRMDENATCEDVMKLAEEEGHWLYFTPHKDPETVLDLGGGTPPEDGMVGAACTVPEDCNTDYCLTSNQLGSLLSSPIDITNGYCSTIDLFVDYCSDECNEANGGFCMNCGFVSKDYAAINLCLRPCEVTGDCRVQDNNICVNPQKWVDNGWISAATKQEYFEDYNLCIPSGFVDVLEEEMSFTAGN